MLFIQVNQEPYQEVATEVDFPLHYIDLSQLALAERQTEAYRHLHREAKHSFQLDKKPLLRVTVIRLDAEEHFLLICCKPNAMPGKKAITIPTSIAVMIGLAFAFFSICLFQETH